MLKNDVEWLKQADYDFDTARIMRREGRNFYAVFMCHLAVEKALKALISRTADEVPPKIHNLVGLLTKIGIKPPENIAGFMIKLNEANVVTRYPEELNEMIRLYDDHTTDQIITSTEEILAWIKKTR